ncbi:MAG: DNA polymerase III [Treponema sp.]|jgi:DNA polymerase-3 subunit gamma/tau|nr:DNA polymerase III [Treponema sp.]
MFENLLGQRAADQIREDMSAGRLAPSMLFFGPPASGKGTAALELARALSCEAAGPGNGPDAAPWNCGCPACAAHRQLAHIDLLVLGSRPFAPEISAARAAFLREPGSAAVSMLFIRSVRKLLIRFSPVLLEDDPKSGKLNPLLAALEEGLGDLELTVQGGTGEAEKISAAIMKSAFKLEAEGIGDHIPIGQIRRAAYWSHLAPAGRRKTLLIENADRMQDGARNSLLKILEEPPETLSIILTAPRREAILPTLLSRLRPYRFLRRDAAIEGEVIRRVFRDALPERAGEAAGLIGAYLDSFLPLPDEKLYPLAAYFIAALARISAHTLRRQRIAALPEELLLLGTHCAPIAEGAGLARPEDIREILARILSETGSFEARSFPRFLNAALSLVSEALRGGYGKPGFIAYIEIWRKYAREADAAAGVWNQNPALALERLFSGLRSAMTAAAARAPEPQAGGSAGPY